jgi:NitT/TauT family transport system ATP-binding protein
MIRLENIGHKYKKDDSFTVKNISFEINFGECVGLTGQSGCGKSTIGSIVAGHIKPTKGRIIVDNEDLTGKTGRNIFLMHQEFDLFPWQKVEKQILFALEKKNLDKAKELLDLVRLNGFENYYPNQLSGGMKKRLSLARALAINPKLLVLDESFSSLDSNLKDFLYEDLRNIWKITKTTILLITHDSKDLDNLAQREIRLTSKKPTTILDIKNI